MRGELGRTINDAMRDTELVLSVVVSVEDQLPMGNIISAIQGVLSSILEFKDINM